MENFGIIGEDIITGFKGIVIGYVQYSTGCNQYLLAPKVDEKGSRIDAEWFDEQRVTFPTGDVVVRLENGSNPGCDRSAGRR